MIISNFIAYAKQAWKNKPDTSTPLSAARLTHLEDGVKGNSDAIEKIAAAVVSQIVNDPNKIASMAALYSVNEKVDSAISDLSNQRRTITRVRVAITNGVGTYNVTQVGLSGGNCIPVIYSMSDGIFWSEVSVAIQNDLVVVGFSSGQSGWAEVNIFSFE